nr:MAG TPA: hypothetical protein [Caudoviricetes sp.]
MPSELPRMPPISGGFTGIAFRIRLHTPSVIFIQLPAFDQKLNQLDYSRNNDTCKFYVRKHKCTENYKHDLHPCFLGIAEKPAELVVCKPCRTDKSECKIAENKYYNQYRTKRKIHFVNSPLDLNQ